MKQWTGVDLAKEPDRTVHMAWRGKLLLAVADTESGLYRQLLARRIVEDELDRIARQTRGRT